ncbi:MAG: DUF1786 family protein [Deltaproteobacteria bacterium]|nr:DUF1786 family protein [Deltaproteobacteria bacterium]
MARFLMIDIGAGTMDLLVYDTDADTHFKAVVRSPVQSLADALDRLEGRLLVTGVEMGGGPVSGVLTRKAAEGEVVMSRASAATIHHSEARVTAAGIRIVEDDRVERLKMEGDFTVFDIADIETERIEGIVHGLGVPFTFDAVAVCAQDHGVPPDGVSHLDYRHQIFKAALDKAPFPHTLLYEAGAVPKPFNRLRSIAMRAKALPAGQVFVMDSGMAAILGASMDPRATDRERFMILDMATSHTLGAALERGEIAGFFEYHTRDIDVGRLEALIKGLAEDALDHAQILQEGGHGATMRKAAGAEAMDLIITTGPKRRLAAPSRLPLFWGAPLGDNMMTGTVGLLEALRRRLGLSAISYL